jgi:Ulp1 family protease
MKQVPQQKNATDCGCYMLHFAWTVMRSPESLIKMMLGNDPIPMAVWNTDNVATVRLRLLQRLVGK